jgi:hypothetical protein
VKEPRLSAVHVHFPQSSLKLEASYLERNLPNDLVLTFRKSRQHSSLTLRKMPEPTKYLLVSLPTSISPTNDKEDALNALRSNVSDNGAVQPFKIPEFKIGTLDALVQQADDLAKLEGSCEAVVAKVGDSLRSLLEGDEEKIAQQKTVNDSRFN